MNYVLLTEGSNVYGLGHIARCISFYDAISQQGNSVKFFVQGDSSVLDLIAHRDVEFIDWHNNIDCIINNYESSVDVLIVDSYHLNQNDANLLSGSNFNMVIIEDFIRLHYTNSIIVDWSFEAENLPSYKTKEKTNLYLLGVEFLSLRKSFWDVNIKDKPTSKSLMITMGGSDIRDLSENLILSIRNKFPLLHISLVVGPGFSNKEKYRSIVDENIDVYFSPQEEEMSSIMHRSNIAISGGGQTLYELSSMQVSIIAIELIDNQKEELEQWFASNMLTMAGSWDDLCLLGNVNKHISSYLNESKNTIQKTKMNNRGVFLILEEIKKFYQ